MHVGKNTFCCHRCKMQGNSLDLLMAISDQPLHVAAWSWIERSGITPPLLAAKKEKLPRQPVST